MASWKPVDLAKLDGDVATLKKILEKNEQHIGSANYQFAADLDPYESRDSTRGFCDRLHEMRSGAIEIIEAAEGDKPSTRLFQARFHAMAFATRLGKRDEAAQHARRRRAPRFRSLR